LGDKRFNSAYDYAPCLLHREKGEGMSLGTEAPVDHKFKRRIARTRHTIGEKGRASGEGDRNLGRLLCNRAIDIQRVSATGGERGDEGDKPFLYQLLVWGGGGGERSSGCLVGGVSAL